MKLLANENIPFASIKALRDKGYDVLSIGESHFGMGDEEVIRISHNEQRIILTFDRDYGTLVYKYPQTIPLGVVYFRFFPNNPLQLANTFLDLINSNLTFENRFTVVEPDRIRQRNLI